MVVLEPNEPSVDLACVQMLAEAGMSVQARNALSEFGAEPDWLAGPDPTPLVTAAVDAAGVAWLAQQYAERGSR